MVSFGIFANSAIGGISATIINCHIGRLAAISAKMTEKYFKEPS
jgi:hypothetical protein